jgi:hypothetical protein
MLLFNCKADPLSKLSTNILNKVIPTDPVIFVFKYNEKLIAELKDYDDISFAVTIDVQVTPIPGKSDDIFWKFNRINMLTKKAWSNFTIMDQICFFIMTSVQEY